MIAFPIATASLCKGSLAMSDHIDGPRQIGDPLADLIDLFAFASPENPSLTVTAVKPRIGAAQ
jgi:hypothetical protein